MFLDLLEVKKLFWISMARFKNVRAFCGWFSSSFVWPYFFNFQLLWTVYSREDSSLKPDINIITSHRNVKMSRTSSIIIRMLFFMFFAFNGRWWLKRRREWWKKRREYKERFHAKKWLINAIKSFTPFQFGRLRN